MKKRNPAVLPAVASGLAAGVIATVVMDQFLKLASSGQKALEKQKKLSEGESEWAVAHEQAMEEQQAAEQEGSTEKVARKVAETAGHHLTPEGKKSAGQAVHYTFGTLVGVLYACTAELLPEATTGAGTAFGTVLFLAADEIAVPAFRLAPPPTKQPASDQLEHWAAHVVYGVTLELARTLLRKAF
jgi:methylthioribose-1-phosphate isomerase